MIVNQNSKIEAKLEWPLLLSQLVDMAQSEEAKQICGSLSPFSQAKLDKNAIEQRWSRVVPLRDLIRSGYKAPIGELAKMHAIFKGAEKGMIFEGSDLRQVYELLHSVKKVLAFLQNFASRSPWLQQVRGQLYALPNLYTAIEKTVATDGSLLDTASDALMEIRNQKVSLRKRIEEQANRLLFDPAIAEYLQDVYFTVRNEKYVIPIRLDGRGRIKGRG